jgi:integrase
MNLPPRIFSVPTVHCQMLIPQSHHASLNAVFIRINRTSRLNILRYEDIRGGCPGEKRKPYIPVVLSRAEIEAILSHLEPPYNLVVKLLYGCGLRLFECVNLRVHCVNFDAGILTVHDGKGQKDRTVPLPQTIFPELRGQLEEVKDLYQRDLKRKYAGVFLPHALEKIQTGRQGVDLAMGVSGHRIDGCARNESIPALSFA